LPAKTEVTVWLPSWLETGEIVQSGPAKDLIHDPRLITAYLGGH